MKQKILNKMFWSTVVFGVVCFGVIVASERPTSELAGAVAAQVEHAMSEVVLVGSLLEDQDTNIAASEKELQVVDFTQVTPELQQVIFVETTPIPTAEPVKVVAEEQELSYEIKQLYRIVHAESAGEPFKGQMAVAAVILNRLETEGFPNNLCEVIMEKNQFSPVQNREIYFCGKVLKSKDVYDSVIEATQRALAGEDPTEKLLWAEAERLGLDPEKYASGGALFFYAPKGCSQESLEEREEIKVKVQIGDHIFYKVWDE